MVLTSKRKRPTTAMIDKNDLATTTAPKKNEKKGVKTMQSGPKTIQRGVEGDFGDATKFT